VCHIRLPGARRPRRHGDASFVPSKSPRARASVDALVSSRGIKKPAEAGGFLSRSPARPFGTAIPFAFRWPASFVYAAFQLFGKRQTIRSVDRQRGPPLTSPPRHQPNAATATTRAPSSQARSLFARANIDINGFIEDARLRLAPTRTSFTKKSLLFSDVLNEIGAAFVADVVYSIYRVFCP
jgi:hypothetical protein